MFTRKKTLEAVPQSEITEAVLAVSYSFINKDMEVLCGAVQVVDGEMKVVDGSTRRETISGPDYAEFMSDKPAWSPSKPAETFRDEDILLFLDEKKRQSDLSS